MNTTPRFALANLSNTKNDSFKSKIFQNIHSNFKNPEQQRTNLNETPYSKGPNLKHHDFFSENNDFLNFESKFGSTYDIKEGFPKEKLEELEMLIQRFSDIKNQNIKKQAFGNFLDDFGLEVPSSDEEDKDPDEYLIKTLKEYRIVEELDRKFSEKEDLFYINKSENELKQEVIYEKPCY